MTGFPISPDQLLAESDWLRRLARQLVADVHTADDLAQETMLAALSGYGPSRGALRSWLTAIARNLAISRARTDSRRSRRERVAAAAVPEASAADTTERFLWHRCVCDAVMTLEEGQRSVLLMRFWDDLPPRLIAARLGLPVETVRTRIKRGLATLRARLDREHQGRAGWLVPLSALGRERCAVPVTVTTLTGTLLMSTKTKSILAVVGLAVLYLGTTLFDGDPSAPDASAVVVTPKSVTLAGTESERPDDTKRSELVTAVALPAAITSPTDANVLAIIGRLIDADTGRPIANAELRRIDWLEWKNRDPRCEPDTISTADGSFRVPILEFDLGHDLLVTSTTHATRLVSVRDCALKPPVFDLGDVKIPTGKLISGIVLDQDRHSIAGATLHRTLRPRYQSVENCNVLRDSLVVGRSDRDGRFTLAERLAAVKPANNWLIALCTQGIGWADLDLQSAQGPRDDLRVVLRPNARLEVEVLNAAGQPVPEVAVRALPAFAPIGSGSQFAQLDSRPELDHHFERITNQYGRADFELPIGDDFFKSKGNRYRLEVRATGYSRQQKTTVDLDADRVTPHQIRLVPNRTLHLHGTLRSEDGSPLVGIRVRAVAVDSTDTLTGEQGHYELEPVLIGTSGVRVDVSADGFVPLSRRLHTDARPVNFTLRQAHVLTGRVRDQHGTAMVGNDVFIDGRIGAKTDAEGRFRIAGISADEHRLDVTVKRSEMFAFKFAPARQVRGDQGEIEIVLERLEGGAQFTAEVVDAVTNEPLEIDETMLIPFLPNGNFGIPLGVETSTGKLTAENLAAGRLWLGILTADGRRGHWDLTVAPGQTLIDRRFEIPAHGTVFGTIDTSALPVAPAAVTLTVTQVPAIKTGFTNYTCAGRWRPYSGQTRDALARRSRDTGTLTMKLDHGSSFVLEAATPTKLRFDAKAPGASGTVIIVVSSGNTSRIELKLTRIEK